MFDDSHGFILLADDALSAGGPGLAASSWVNLQSVLYHRAQTRPRAWMILDSFDMHYISGASAKSLNLDYLRTGAKSMVASS